MKKNMIIAAAINAMLGRLGEDCVLNHNLTIDSVYAFVQPADSDGWNIVRAIRAIKYEKQIGLLNKLMERVNRKIEVASEDMDKMDKIERWEHRDCLQRIDEDIVWYLQQIENYNKPFDELDYDSEMAYYEMEPLISNTTVTIHIGQSFHWSINASSTTAYVDVRIETKEHCNEYRLVEYDPEHYDRKKIVAEVKTKFNEIQSLNHIVATMQSGKENKKQFQMKLTTKNGEKFGLGTVMYAREDKSSYIVLEVWPIKPGGYLFEHVEFRNEASEYSKMIYALYNGDIESMIEASED